jgi:hypothetical protein
MLFLIDEKRKVIFGWSAKSGCSHIKNIFYYLQTDLYCGPQDRVHRGKGQDFQPLPENLSEYTLLLFIRNPYKRLVSGFLDKYGPTGEFRHLWDCNLPLTFSNFVDAIYQNDSKMVDNHHFTPQTSEHFCDRIKNHSKTFIYDIENIDYAIIEYIFQKELPDEVIDYRGPHQHKYDIVVHYDVYDTPIDDYCDCKPLLSCYFDEDIYKKVGEIYKKDFDFFLERGFVYTIK